MIAYKNGFRLADIEQVLSSICEVSRCEQEQGNIRIKVLENYLNQVKTQLSLVQREKDHLDELNKKKSAYHCPEPDDVEPESSGDRRHQDDLIRERLRKFQKKALELESQIR